MTAIGQVVGIHISDEILVEGRVDLSKAKPIARLAMPSTPWLIRSSG